MSYFIYLRAVRISVVVSQESMSADSATHSSANSHLRVKILEAAASMHNALGVRDIGRAHYIPLFHKQSGVTFLVCVNMVREGQTAQGLAVHWIKMEKLLKKV